MCVFANIDMSVAVKCLRIYIQHFCARKGDEHKIPLTVFGAKCCCKSSSMCIVHCVGVSDWQTSSRDPQQVIKVTVLEWFNSKCERVCDIVAGL